MKVSKQILNGSTDRLRLQKSRAGHGLHLLELPEVIAVLKTKARLCVRAKGGFGTAATWCVSSLKIPARDDGACGTQHAHHDQHTLPQSISNLNRQWRQEGRYEAEMGLAPEEPAGVKTKPRPT